MVKKNKMKWSTIIMALSSSPRNELEHILTHVSHTEKVQVMIPTAHFSHMKKRGNWVRPRDKRIKEFKNCASALKGKLSPEFISVMLSPFFLKQFDVSKSEMQVIVG
jgi:hypothetical protein